MLHYKTNNKNAYPALASSIKNMKITQN